MKVRIAVAVDSDGDWNSCGWSDGSDADKMSLATEPLPGGDARYWLEAELPIPEVQTVVAQVSGGKA